MNVLDLAPDDEFVGGLAVLVTVLFLVFRLRQNAGGFLFDAITLVTRIGPGDLSSRK